MLLNPGFIAAHIVLLYERLVYRTVDAISNQTGSTLFQLTQPLLALAFELLILKTCQSILLSKILCCDRMQRIIPQAQKYTFYFFDYLGDTL